MNKTLLEKLAKEHADWESRQAQGEEQAPVEFEFKRSDDTEGGTCD
jgi:hypothetical protein